MAAFLLIGIIIGAGSYQLYVTAFATTQPAQLSLNQMYTNAIEDAMVAKQSEVYNGLTAITENNSNLIWQGGPGNQNLLVVTWTKYASSYPVGETVNTTWGYTWVTVAPQIQTFFKEHVNADTNATLRAAELLGLPPNTSGHGFC